ncbi:MAG: beta-lactamase superfamily domain protein [Rhizobiaceae bacterium]|jgi:glyoxylase-like metal-dependent hydrolase (beta-lactamase superfamily II)|nr:beta-lactamase superfamily domain protein [Rhizobiaceae bacterium]
MATFTRRGFATSILSLPVLATLPSAALARAPRGPAKPVMPLARLDVGRFEVTFLSDGFIDFPFALFTGATADEVERLSAAHFVARKTGVRRGFTAWLIRDGDQLMLVDSGPAGTVSKTSGRLPSALAAIGVRPEMIDAVIVTHMHVDHIAGLVSGGRANFANAEVYVDRREVAHFTDPAKGAAAPDLLKSSFATAQQLVRLYPRLQRIDGERQITRGISTIDLSGHTPGQLGLRIEDSGQSLLIVSDMIFHPAHPVLPTLGLLFEADKAAADAARMRFFPRAAEAKALLAATHMPFPGLGRIVKDGGTPRWLAADWEYTG